MDVKSLEVELNETLAVARDIASKADSRSFTEDEKKSMEETLATAKDIRSRLDEARDSQALRDSVKELGEGLGNIEVKETTTHMTESKNMKKVGDWFVNHEVYKDLMKRGLHGTFTTGPVEFGAKATVSESASPIVEPSLVPGVVDIRGTDFYKPTMADLFAQGSTTSNSIRYIVESTATNAAAGTAEEGSYPESTLVFETKDEPVRKISTFLPATDEILEDSAVLASYLNNRLAYMVQVAEDDALLNGDGSAPNLEGLLARDIQDNITGSGSLMDAIYNGITAVRTETSYEPDAMVCSPSTWAALRLSKDDNGMYLAGSPFGQNGADSLFGLRVVVTPRLTDNSVLVGAFRAGGQVFRRGGVTVEVSNSHSDWFVKGINAIRSETRLALAVYRPEAFALCSAS